jgi:hypothetical protein
VLRDEPPVSGAVPVGPDALAVTCGDGGLCSAPSRRIVPVGLVKRPVPEVMVSSM